ncbi:hypothetical protein EV359DRAFT_81883 [Lentinula novae-zelandiae]|nr:hypothetical protein EV359DRAFT_81883 [Lentinula novae-zelandiae]
MNAPKPCPSVPLPASPAPPAPLVVRRRSSTFTSISNWANAVQPGSPAPYSPPLYSPAGSPGLVARRPSLPRRPSISAARGINRRRPSISHTRARSGSASFLQLVDTPTTAGHRSIPTPGPASPGKVSDFDLTNLGYTSIFVHLPHTPSTPSPFVLPANTDKIPIPSTPGTPPAAPTKGLKRFRSLGMLKGHRRRGKSVAPLASPSTTAAAPPIPCLPSAGSASIPPSSPTHRIPAVTKSKPVLTPPPSTTTFKKAKKASAAAAPPLPPTFANELLLMQFMGGGSLETHAKRVMEKQARDVAPAGHSKDMTASTTAGTAPFGVGVGAVYRDEKGMMWWDAEEAVEYQPLLPPSSPGSPGSPSRTWVLFGHPSPRSHILAGFNVQDGDERRGSVTSSIPSSPSLSLSLNHMITPAPIDTAARAMHLLRIPTGEMSVSLAVLNSSLTTASGTAARQRRNKRTRRRPAPLKLHSAPAVPTASHVLHLFDDSFVPSPAMRRTGNSSGDIDISAPATCTDFPPPPKEPSDLFSIKEAKITKIGFKGKARALFGGFA